MRLQLQHYVLSVLLLFVASCAEDSLPDKEGGDYNGSYQFTAYLENMEVTTKTVVNDNGQVQWASGDVIGVYGTTTDNARFETSQTPEPSTSAAFSGTLTKPDASPAWAYYPYQTDATTDEQKQSLSILLPAEYDYNGRTELPLLGHLSGSQQMQFKHLTGALRVSLHNIPEDAYDFVLRSAGEGALPLAGHAAVANVKHENAVLHIDGEGKYEVTYRIGRLAADEDSRTFFIPLPVGEYEELQIEVRREDGTAFFTRSLGTQNIARAQIVSVPVVNFSTGQGYVLQDNTHEITDEMDAYTTLTAINEETGYCTLEYAQAPAGGLPAVGDVLLKPGISDKFPQGFLGKVAEVKESGGKYVVTTAPACLNDAFKELVVDAEVDLVPEDMKAQTKAADWEYNFVNFKVGIDIGQQNGLYAKGELELGLKLHIQIDLAEQLCSYTLKDYVGVNAAIGVRAELGGDLKRTELGPSIPLGVILIPTLPVPLTINVQPCYVYQLTGKFNISGQLSFSHGTETTAVYWQDRWSTSQKPIAPNSKSPWDFGNLDYSFEGTLFHGISAELDLSAFQLNKFFAVGIEGQIGTEASGKLDMKQIMTATNKEELLNGASLNSKYVVRGNLTAHMNLLNLKEQAAITFMDLAFGEVTLKAIPDVEMPQAEVQEESESTSKAEVETTISEQLLSKQTTLTMQLENEEGAVVQESKATAYKGEPEADEIPQAEIKEEFKGLENDHTFKSYPAVSSPLLGDEKVKLTSKSVTFSTQKGTLREQLIRMYNHTNGEGWKNNENWCSDKPLTEWYGISQDAVGMYTISLSNNNLQGAVELSDPSIINLLLSDNQITHVNVNKCTGLRSLSLYGNPTERLYLVGCKELLSVNYDQDKLRTLDMSESNFVELMGDAYFTNLKNLYARNLTELTDIPIRLIGGNDLDSLDLSGCTHLQTLNKDRRTSIGIEKYVNLEDCRELLFDDDHNAQSSTLSWRNIEYLNISGCNNLENIGNIYVPASIKELHVAECKSLRRLTVGSREGPALTDLDLSGCENLRYLQSYCTQLQSLRVDGCVQLDTIYSMKDQLTTLNTTPFGAKLKRIELLDTQLTSIDLSNSKELKYMILSTPNMKQINLSACRYLEELQLGMPLQSIDLSQNTRIRRMNLWDMEIEELNLNPCKGALQELHLSGNDNLHQVDFHGCNKLEELWARYGQLETLDVSGLPVLQELDLDNETDMSSVDMSNCPALQEVALTAPSIKEVNVSDCPQIRPDIVNRLIGWVPTIHARNLPTVTEIDYPYSAETQSLDVSGCKNLQKIRLASGGLGAHTLQRLILNGCTGLQELDCRYSQLTTLDVSTCEQLKILDCDWIQTLNTIILPQGPRPFYERFSCHGTRVTQEIPDWFPGPSDPNRWGYEQRYTYKLYEDGIHAEDKGYGWWYPGEPECGYHRK